MNTIVLAAAIGLGWFGETPPVEPAYAATPEFCWSEPRWIEDDRAKDPASDPVAIGRAIAAQVIYQKASNGWRGRSFGNRMAEHVAGRPRRGEYVEVQFYICDNKGNPKNERNPESLDLPFRYVGSE